jgi:hypothetical protein
MVAKKTTKQTGGKKKMNDFMKAKEQARKNNREQFEYTSKQGVKKTYVKFVMPTGMVAYKAK